MDSNAWLDQVRQAHGLTSDYQLSKLLGVGSSRIGNYRSGRSEFDEDMAARVGAALQVHPAHVLATVRAGKARTERAREVWESIAREFGQVACLVGAVLLVLASPDWSGEASAAVDITACAAPFYTLSIVLAMSFAASLLVQPLQTLCPHARAYRRSGLAR